MNEPPPEAKESWTRALLLAYIEGYADAIEVPTTVVPLLKGWFESQSRYFLFANGLNDANTEAQVIYEAILTRCPPNMREEAQEWAREHASKTKAMLDEVRSKMQEN